MFMFGRSATRGKKNPVPTTLQSLSDTNVYPVLTGEELTVLLGVGSHISAIKRHASVSPDMYVTHYEALIHRFMEAAQLQPASATDHHSGLGGLITHTLDVVESAMAMRRALVLPMNADVELIAREEMSWTYGVFVAAMLHDAGKLLTLTHLSPTGKQTYSPLTGTILDTQAESYKIVWASDEVIRGVSTMYELQTRIAVSMLGLVPKDGMELIGRNINILKELTAYLSDLPYEWGAIGKLCRDADMKSVAKDMQRGISREQLTNAPSTSLAKRMISALRSEIKRLSVPINKDGASAWVTDDTIWIVCKVAAKRIRESMEDHGSEDIPKDDFRIFEILIDHGFATPTPEGDAIWYVHVKSDTYAHPLTMLCFPRESVVHPSRKLKPFTGEVTPVSKSEFDALRQKRAPAPDNTPQNASAIDHAMVDSHFQATPQAQPYEPAGEPDVPIESPSSSEQTHAAPTGSKPPSPARGAKKRTSLAKAEPRTIPDSGTGGKSNGTGGKSKKNQPISALTADQLRAEATQSHQKATERAAAALNAAVIKKRSDLHPDPVPLDDKRIGQYFLTWVREAIDNDIISLTSRKPPIHFILDEEHDYKGVLALIAWPAVGHRFMKGSGLEPSEDPAQKKIASNYIRRGLKNEELIFTRPKKYDIWHGKFPQRPGIKQRPLYCLVAPAWTLFDVNEMPEINKDLTLSHGDYNPNHISVEPHRQTRR